MNERLNRLNVGFGLIIIVATVWTADTTATRIAAAALLLGADALLLSFRRMRAPWALVAVFAAMFLSLGAEVLVVDGLAVVIVLVAVARLPLVISDKWRQPAVIGFAIVFGVTIGLITHSYLGLLAALGIPFIAERTVERRELAAERDRAVRLLSEIEASRDAQADAAALAERGRIARDMHDVLAHTLAGLSLQLQGVRAVAAREGVGPAVSEPLDRAAALARDGVAEARNVVGALRGPHALGVAEIDALVSRYPGSATLTATGEPVGIEPAAGLAVYRTVQEALTNAARYAAGSPVDVRLAWSPTELQLRVTDHGVQDGRAPTGVVGSGMGLVGMSERITEVGGTLRAGPLDGGWTVQASVPVASDR